MSNTSDLRQMVDRARVDQAKKTVAMTAIRALDESPEPPAAAIYAMFPMLLDMYLSDPAARIDEAIERHRKDCKGASGSTLMCIAGKLGLPGCVVAFFWRLPLIAEIVRDLQ